MSDLIIKNILENCFKDFLSHSLGEYHQNFEGFSLCLVKNKVFAVFLKGENNNLYLHKDKIFAVNIENSSLTYDLSNYFIKFNTQLNFKNYLHNYVTDHSILSNLSKFDNDEIDILIDKYNVITMVNKYHQKINNTFNFINNLFIEADLLQPVNSGHAFLSFVNESEINEQVFLEGGVHDVVEYLEVKSLETDLDYSKLISFFKKQHLINDLIIKKDF